MATVIPRSDLIADVHLAEPLRGVTPGQTAVFYEDDRCLGGGTILEARSRAEVGEELCRH